MSFLLLGSACKTLPVCPDRPMQELAPVFRATWALLQQRAQAKEDITTLLNGFIGQALQNGAYLLEEHDGTFRIVQSLDKNPYRCQALSVGKALKPLGDTKVFLKTLYNLVVNHKIRIYENYIYTPPKEFISQGDTKIAGGHCGSKQLIIHQKLFPSLYKSFQQNQQLVARYQQLRAKYKHVSKKMQALLHYSISKDDIDLSCSTVRMLSRLEVCIQPDTRQKIQEVNRLYHCLPTAPGTSSRTTQATRKNTQ